MTDVLGELREAVRRHREAVDRANAELDAAVLRAYRSQRPDKTPELSLAQIGEALGVSRQRAHQLVREVAARDSAG